MPVVLMDMIFRIIKGQAPFFLKPIIGFAMVGVQAGLIRPRIDTLLQQAETDLGTAPWFGGDTLTAAEIAISFPMEYASVRGYITDAHPNCRAWVERVHAHPSFKIAKAKDGRPSVILSL